MGIYERIKGLCEKGEITIKQLEKELGLGNGAIAKWQVSSPRVDNLLKIAKYFGISVDYLLDVAYLAKA